MSIPYDLDNPDSTYKLPERHVEISGIWPLPGEDALVFVQDEALQVHHLDLSSGAVTEYNTHGFHDSEDIVAVDDTVYILTAGEQPMLHEIIGYSGEMPVYRDHDLRLDPLYDPEGLCLDVLHKRLLIACKGSPLDGDSARLVFAFDLQSKQRSEAPVLVIDSSDFLDDEGIFHPSGIAIHPQTGEVYVVSTRSIKMIVRYSPEGCFLGKAKLRKKRFPQPEGITFAESGDLFIASEGKKNKKARIYRFRYEDS
jgi:uncharacterized protein YjiK